MSVGIRTLLLYITNISLIASRYRVLIEVKKGFPNVSAGGHGARVSDSTRERLPSAISSQSRIRAGSEPASRSTPDPSQIHPRSTPDPPQVHPRSRCRSRCECRSRFNTQLIAYFAIRVLLWGNIFQKPAQKNK